MADGERLEVARSLALSLTTVGRDPAVLLALAERLAADAAITTVALRAMAAAVEGRAAGSAMEPAPRRTSPLRTDRSGRAGTHPDHSGELLQWALREAAAAGAELERVGQRGQTYRSHGGRLVHVRTMKRHDRGQGRYSYWFGIAEELWTPGAVFMLVCDRDGVLVVPSEEFLPYREHIAMAKGTHRQPNIWRVDGRFELRASGQHFDFSAWVDRFDVL